MKSKFLDFAPMFKEVLQPLAYASALSLHDEGLSPDSSSAVTHAMRAVALCSQSSTYPLARAEAGLARAALEEIYNTGSSNKGGDMILGSVILLFYHLYEGDLIQNARHSIEALGWCMAAGLHIDPELLPDGYAIGRAEELGNDIRLGRLFWLAYILNVQVLTCAIPFSLGQIRNGDITTPLPSRLDHNGTPTAWKQHVDSADLYENHRYSDWLSLYAKSAILLRDMQSLVNTIITTREAMPLDVVVARLDALRSRLCAFQSSHSVIALPFNQAMIIRAMIAACHILPRSPTTRGTHHRGLHQASSSYFADALTAVKDDATKTMSLIQINDRYAMPDIEPFVVYVWMMTNRVCLHPDTSPLFEGGFDPERTISIADATYRAVAAVESLGIPAAKGCMRILRCSQGLLAENDEIQPIERTLAVFSRYADVYRFPPGV